MEAEPITPTSPRDAGRTVFTQRWEELTFLHWAVRPEQVAPHLPPGTRPDTFEGRTYVGLIPFWMQGIGLGRGPGLPYVGSFHETNVRLYSVDEQGRRGVVFVSLDASRLAPVLAARWGPGLPYLWSRMDRRRSGERVTYTCSRRWPGPRGARSRISVRVGPPIEAGPLEHFLTARWGLHLPDRGGRTRYWPNEHPAWPLHDATVDEVDDELLAVAGFADLAARAPDHAMFSPGVDVVFGPRNPALQP
ncbi:hypothetical protein C7S10_07035 [Nocardioides currus]|uniref:DUF2071 domain-containing protein n=1 Tax=Nocardioides currus TaxID=2133958 RepID=A0A2R7Z0J1_9ACTN|nr:hypothetical protein C7S10_07035 [Nocardioides currus]